MGKLDGPDAGNHVFNRPLISKDIKKFKARGTHMNAVRDGIGDHRPIQVGKEFRIKKIGMVGRVAPEGFFKFKRFLSLLTLKPSLIKIFFKRIRLIPFRRFSLLILLGSDQLRDLVRIREPIRHKVRSHNNDRALQVRNVQRRIGNDEELPCHVGLPVP